MRKLSNTELYNLKINASEWQDIQTAITGKLNQNVGIIAPEQVSPELMQLRIKMKSTHLPFAGEAISLFEGYNGRIKLFNLGVTSNGRTPIPAYYPYLPGKARDRLKQIDDSSSTGLTQTMFVNMNRIGNWSADEKEYLGISYLDLYTALESGLIGTKLLIENQADKVFSDKVVLENLTKIYTMLFSQAVIKTNTVYSDPGFTADAASFLIAKFFLIYVLTMTAGDTVDSYAAACAKGGTSLVALKSFEDAHTIDYTSLSGFLTTLGNTIFNEPINLLLFHNNWLNMYGEGMVFAVEYAPYLLHFLFATWHNSYLGGSVRLQNRINLFKKELGKLYVAVTTILR